MIPGSRMRILHVHSDLHSGGVEQWLLGVARRIDRRDFQFAFYAATASDAWKRAADELGFEVIGSPRPRALFKYVAILRDLLRSRNFDVVHCHFIDHTGLVLREAALAGVPCRIAHSHIDAGPILGSLSAWKRLYIAGQHRWLRRYATGSLAASRAAARSMFGPNWEAEGRCVVLPCGIDIEALAAPVDRARMRAALGFAPSHVVFGHVGRFMPQKNHAFLVEVAGALARILPEARFLWVGDGPLKDDVRRQAAAAGLEKRALFAGIRADIPQLLSAMDVFVFPSLFEGLGLAVVEAQAAGLPCLISSQVPEEADVVPRLVMRLPLTAGPQAWAEALVSRLPCAGAMRREESLAAVRASAFNIETSTRALQEFYHDGF